MLAELKKKDANIEKIAKMALKEEKLLSELVNNLKSKEETVRYNSYKVILLISEEQPDVIYPRWDFLESMMDGSNAYWRSSSARLIGNLARVDKENKFEKILDRYYNLLNDSVIVAYTITACSGRIAKAKLKLQAKITEKLLNIDKTNQKHKDLIKAGAIESFSEYFEEAKNKKKILKFVKEQLGCESPKTRKIAKEFLKRWEE